MGLRSALCALGLAAAAFLSVPSAGAAPDPYSPNQLPPSPSFYAAYSNVAVTSSYVPRSPSLRTFGVILILAGGLALVAAPIVGTSGTSSGSDPTAPAPTDGAVLALAVGGLGLLAVGVPSAVNGSTLVPPPPRAPSQGFRVEPAPGGLRLTF